MIEEERTPRSRTRVQISTGPGKTIQSFKDDLDITKIVSRYLATGERPTPPGTVRWGSTMPEQEFQERAESVAEIEQWFEAQPSKTRSLFDNDPAKALAFLEAEKNREQAENMGMVQKPEPKADTKNPAGESGENGENGEN